jgi:hypothetical protein
MQTNTAETQTQLNVDFSETSSAAIPFAAGRIQVRVTDNHDPRGPIPGSQVVAMDGTTTLTTGVTGLDGEITLEIDLKEKSSKGQELFIPKTITVMAAKNGFTQITQSKKTVTVIAIATIDVRLELAPQ